MDACLADYDIADTLPAVSCPTLIIHGDYDTIPLESAEMIHKQIGDSKLVVVKECGHFPFIEAPEFFLREVNSFMVANKGF